MSNTIADIMSRGVRTVEADAHLRDIIGQCRRIGHEGFPVTDSDGVIVGLLTARDMNRADANALAHLKVSDVMLLGDCSLPPDFPLQQVPEHMHMTGWGQIPIVEDGELIGILTRTDILRYYASQPPGTTTGEQSIARKDIEQVLGADIAKLINLVATEALKLSIPLYMVGGVVRDLILRIPNQDIDFVMESNAIDFAHVLAAAYGGKVEAHEIFGTAKWVIDDKTASKIDAELAQLPRYIDLVTARHEFYEAPAALPNTYRSGIRLDLRRRDFTINALAVYMNKGEASGTIIDLFGGLHDMADKKIRALHSLSFADDPTRTLRAVRFAGRLGFSIEPRTAELIQTARPLLGRITGERVQNELTLLLNEDHAATSFQKLQDIGVLVAIHPDFVLAPNFHALMEKATSLDTSISRWHVVAASMSPESVAAVAARLLMGKTLTQQLMATTRLMNEPDQFIATQPSKTTEQLEALPLDSIITVAHLSDDQAVIETLYDFLRDWRHRQPYTDGNRLKQLGLAPGPSFRVILKALRTAWLDGEIASRSGEDAYLKHLIEQEQPDD